MMIASNWKMNQSPQEASVFIQEFKKQISEKDQSSFIFLIPALYFGILNSYFLNTKIQWGGQNCFSKKEGPFTGENSPQSMKQMGATHCLVGHSERRRLFFEDNSSIREKLKNIIDCGLIPILCVGENLEQKNQRKKALESQLKILKDIDKSQGFVVAYEPVWAIGTGQTATSSLIQEACQDIKEITRDDSICIFYGGSVDESSVKKLCQIKELSGFLVGSASLDLKKLILIYQQTRR